ncbi:MAG TPA: hypothetical protein VNZ86_13485 [Bacteroidia bacterium]|nr:hypothetical protein [Bacteroidia bacterium]
MTTPSKKVAKKLAALYLSKLTPPQVVALAEHCVAQMTGNAHFPAPNPALSTVTAQATALSNAYNVSQTRARGTVGAMHVELKKLDVLLKLLAAYVESIANADPLNAEIIIQSAGMIVKKPAARAPKTFTAIPGKLKGQVILNTKAAKQSAYIYQITTDPNTGNSWTTVYSGTKVKFIVTGLTSATHQYFRVAYNTKGVQGNWSDPAQVLVP